MIAPDRCAWVLGWTDSHINSYGWREAESRACLNKLEPR